MSASSRIKLPDYAKIFRKPKRYKVLYGGRGSAKSYTIARLLLAIGAQKRIRCLCAREFQNSIADSVHKLLSDQAKEIGLQEFYKVTESSIIGKNGSEFIFKGIRMNVNSIRSMVGLTHVWLEEAQSISQNSWDTIIPTIREDDSEIWVSFNPDSADDPTFRMFCNPDGTPRDRDDAFILKVNWNDNPWFPEVLKKEMTELYKVNPELAGHVWGGDVRSHSDAQIFKNKWIVRAFEPLPTYDGPYFGVDWGFSVDPTCIVKCYLDLHKNELLVRNAVYIRGREAELQNLKYTFNQISDLRKRVLRADSARPDTIAYMSQQGFNIEGAEKGPGSVEHGIEYLKCFNQIVIHPDCESGIIENGNKVPYGLVTEAKNYSYKVDRLTQDVLTDVVDAYNHGWDAIRYALEPMIKSNSIGLLQVL